MKKMIAVLGSLYALFLPSDAMARIGESIQQCIERYGEVAKVRGDPMNGNGGALVFEKGDLRITCVFPEWSDRCEMISYYRDSNGLPIADKIAILDQIRNEGEWAGSGEEVEEFRVHTITGDIAVLDRKSLIIVSKRHTRKTRGFEGL